MEKINFEYFRRVVDECYLKWAFDPEKDRIAFSENISLGSYSALAVSEKDYFRVVYDISYKTWRFSGYFDNQDPRYVSKKTNFDLTFAYAPRLVYLVEALEGNYDYHTDSNGLRVLLCELTDDQLDFIISSNLAKAEKGLSTLTTSFLEDSAFEVNIVYGESALKALSHEKYLKEKKIRDCRLKDLASL